MKNEFESENKTQASSAMNSPSYSDSNESTTLNQPGSVDHQEQQNTIEYEQKDLDLYDTFDFEDSLKAKKRVLIASKSTQDSNEKPGIYVLSRNLKTGA